MDFCLFGFPLPLLLLLLLSLSSPTLNFQLLHNISISSAMCLRTRIFCLRSSKQKKSEQTHSRSRKNKKKVAIENSCTLQILAVLPIWIFACICTRMFACVYLYKERISAIVCCGFCVHHNPSLPGAKNVFICRYFFPLVGCFGCFRLLTSPLMFSIEATSFKIFLLVAYGIEIRPENATLKCIWRGWE